MYFDIEPEGRVVVHWTSVNLVPDFKNLITSFGKNAMHYLFLWASPLSPYFRIDDKAQRHQLITGALKDVAVEKGRKIPDGLWQQAEFTLAEKRFKDLVPEIEAREEANIARMRQALSRELERIMEESEDENAGTLLKDQLSTVKDIITSVSALRKEHTAAREALNQRIQSDDNTAIILAQA